MARRNLPLYVLFVLLFSKFSFCVSSNTCYLYMEPELIDAAAISAIGGFESKAGRFVGSSILGYQTRNGYSVTNLGNVYHPNIVEAMFIPPASPANIKTMGILSVNYRLMKCTACYQ